jgi:pimeloyl-ACP methyl ester carboxylesterase
MVWPGPSLCTSCIVTLGTEGDQEVDEQQITVSGQQLAFRQSEGQERPVIFVHGNSCSSRTWEPVLKSPFGQRFRCLAFDLPGHGNSAKAKDPADYSLPGYAKLLTGFAAANQATDAVIVGWSLGGHIALEAAPAMPAAPGFVIFGTPPIASADQMGEAFLPNPAMATTFAPSVTGEEARAYAEAFTAPRSALDLDEIVADVLRTDGAARADLGASLAEGCYADEIAITSTLGRPLAILHGEGEQLVSLDYLRTLSIPTLWRGEIQLIPGAGHAPHLETPDQFTALLTQFLAET